MNADIVYIGNDLPNGRAPRVDYIYKLALATSINTRVPIEGVQLKQDDSPCGWIREYNKMAIIDALRAGFQCYCLVKCRRQFIWGREVCFWGEVQWWIDLDEDQD